MIFLLFIMFNLENKSDISFGFTKINDAPVYVTAFFAFLAGMLCTVPLVLGLQKKKQAGDTPPPKQKNVRPKKPHARNGDYGVD